MSMDPSESYQEMVQTDYASKPMSTQGALYGFSGAMTTTMANTMKARLARAVALAEERLTDAKRAKEIFDQHPYLEELLTIIQKGNI